jgi:hypothetical protein
MSFWKSLFGGSASAGAAAAKASTPEAYNGFLIRAEPFKAGAQYQVAGFIEKDIDGTRKEHHFIRADYFPTQEDAVTFSLSKARQIVDLLGDRVFD